jgi:cyclase
MTAYRKGLHEIGDGVWAYLQPDGSWGWSNAGLVTGGGRSLLVDTLFDLRLTAEMLAEMRRTVPAANQIGTVVNTHANGDHCWGNELLGDAEIVASRACADEMGEPAPQVLGQMVAAAPSMGKLGEYVGRIFGPFHFDEITLRPPTSTFEGELELQVGDRRVQLIEVGPAHTRGDVLVALPDDKVVFTGDILFAGGHPIVWAGPVGNWVRALDRILAMDVDTVVPGHGPVTDKAAVAGLKEYLQYLSEEARVRMEAGLTPLEAARDIDLSRYRDWGEAERVVVNVAAVYRELEPSAPVPSVMELFSDMAELASTSA